MTRLSAVLVCTAAGLAMNAWGAEPIDVLTHTPPRVYEGQSVVRVTAESQRQVQAALALAESLWSEGAGVGSFDIQIHADRIPVLLEAGLQAEVRIPDLQAHADRAWDRVRQTERRLRDRAPAPRGATAHDETWFENYKQLAQIETYIDAVHAARPDLTTLEIVGQSLQNRPIRAVTITGPDRPGNAAADRPVVLWNGCQHAREWVSPMTVVYIASRLVDDYDADPAVRDLVDNIRFVVVPMANPDGYLYSWSSERFWRKNRRQNNTEDFGVDLNRNWGYQWGGDGSSGNPSSDIYRGTSPFSEPETQVLRDLGLSFGSDLVAHIDYHTFSQLILYPFGYASGVQAPEPDRTFFDNLSTDMSDLILAYSGEFYDPIPSWQLYPAAGGATDWFYGDAGAKSLTLELRPASGGLGSFDPPPETILPTAHENYEAARFFAARTARPVAFTLAPPHAVEAGEPTTLGFGVASALEDFDPTSVAAFAAVGDGPLAPIPVSPAGPGRYTATLPPVPCGQSVSYAFAATTLDGQTVTFPGDETFTADAVRTVFADDFTTDQGWTVGAPGDDATSGVWVRANPVGTTTGGTQVQPQGALFGDAAYITGQHPGGGAGANDVDNGRTTLTTPRLDLSDADGTTTISYWRWYSNSAGANPFNDVFVVDISSDDGQTWVNVETVGPDGPQVSGGWFEHRFNPADLVPPTDQVRLRFVASDDDPQALVEAAVDGFRIQTLACDAGPGCAVADIAEPFGVLNFFDVAAFMDLYNAGDPFADFNSDGLINFFDVAQYIQAYIKGCP